MYLVFLHVWAFFVTFAENLRTMDSLRYPVGIQTFSKIIEEGYAYVDKTHYIARLIKEGQYIFLSRPRRFGKSLLLSTLEAYFEGRRELFKGLAIDSMDVDWITRPVFRFDLNSGQYGLQDGLKDRLIQHLSKYEDKYGIEPRMEHDVVLRFESLISEVYKKTGRKVVILIDEYDKPLLTVDEHQDQFENNQTLLKGFFSNLKSMDSCIQFAMLTGVSRFSKVSIFSDLNNLDDISMENSYANICGWTEEELVRNFRIGIESLAEERNEDFNSTLKALRDFYDGYLFTVKGSRLYNPFSVLKALKAKEIDPYWFVSGTPTFLVKRIKARGTFPAHINGKMCSKKELMAVGINDSNPIPLMFQTGYLTIGRYIEDLKLYELRFPNREVEISFYEDLLKVYAPSTSDPDSQFNFAFFKMDLFEGRPEDFMKRLEVLLKDLPGEDHHESTYRALTYLLTVLCGTTSIAEHSGYKGRSDIEVVTGKYVYVFEFKYNRNVEEAMEQIYSRDYAGRFALDTRTMYLIGANFSEKKDNRGLTYAIKKMEK